MKLKLITLLCVLMSISFCFAQSSNTIIEIKIQQDTTNEDLPIPSSLMEEPRAFLHQPWLSVSMPESKEAVVSIQNQLNGRIVYHQTYFHTQGMMIDLSGMPAGTYQLRIEMDGTVYTGTFRL